MSFFLIESIDGELSQGSFSEKEMAISQHSDFDKQSFSIVSGRQVSQRVASSGQSSKCSRVLQDYKALIVEYTTLEQVLRWQYMFFWAFYYLRQEIF